MTFAAPGSRFHPAGTSVTSAQLCIAVSSLPVGTASANLELNNVSRWISAHAIPGSEGTATVKTQQKAEFATEEA